MVSSSVKAQLFSYCNNELRAPWEEPGKSSPASLELDMHLHSIPAHLFPRHAKLAVASLTTKWENLVHFLKFYYWCLL